MGYELTFTDKGSAAIAESIINANAKVDFAKVLLGSETEFSSETMVWSGDATVVVADESGNVEVHTIVPAYAGGFTVRSAALADTDGNILAKGMFPQSVKPDASGASALQWNLRFAIQTGGAAVIEAPKFSPVLRSIVSGLITDECKGYRDETKTMHDEVKVWHPEIENWAELIGEYKYKVLTRTEFDALATKETDTIYFVKGDLDIGAAVIDMLAGKYPEIDEETTLSVTQAVLRESEFRAESDKTLQSNIEAEKTLREAAIDAEATTRKTADETEATARQAAIDAEATTRKTADDALDTRISAAETTLAGIPDEISAAVAAETSERQNADAELQTAITNIEQTTTTSCNTTATTANQAKADVAALSDKFDEWETSVSSALHYKGSVATNADLPEDNNTTGDFYNVTEMNQSFAWNGSEWSEVTGMFSVPTATVNTAGVVKLGTGTALTTSTGGVVGATTDGQLLAKAAGDSTLGTVKLNDVVKKELWHGNGTYWYAFNEGSRTLNMKAKPIHGLQKFTWDDGKSLEFPTIAANASETIATATEVNTNATAIETEVARAKAAEEANAAAIAAETTRATGVEAKKGGYLATSYSANAAAIVLFDEYKSPTSSMVQLSTTSIGAAQASRAGVMTGAMFTELKTATTTLAALEARVAALEAAINGSASA